MEKCDACGAPLENNTCSYCGTSDTVPGTGSPSQQMSPAVSSTQTSTSYVTITTSSTLGAPRLKSKWVALLLCVFLGYFGVHNFYSGKIGLGVLYFLTLGIFGVGWIIDIIRIAIGSYKDKWGRDLEV